MKNLKYFVQYYILLLLILIARLSAQIISSDRFVVRPDVNGRQPKAKQLDEDAEQQTIYGRGVTQSSYSTLQY